LPKLGLSIELTYETPALRVRHKYVRATASEIAGDHQRLQEIKGEECRLLAISGACSAEEHAVADQLLNQRHSLLYPVYMRLVDAYQAIGSSASENDLQSATHRKTMRDEGK
jgi:hypothetical protein